MVRRVYTFPFSCMMVWWWCTFRTGTSWQAICDCTATHWVWLWMLICTCDYQRYLRSLCNCQCCHYYSWEIKEYGV